MKQQHKWTPEELQLMERINGEYRGQASTAFREHKDWKKTLFAAHTQGAIYAKLNVMRKKAKAPALMLTPLPAPTVPKVPRFLVISPEQLEAVTCPKCSHGFHLFTQR